MLLFWELVLQALVYNLVDRALVSDPGLAVGYGWVGRFELTGSRGMQVARVGGS